MKMLPKLHSHNEYINFTEKNLQDVYIPKAHDDVLPKLKLLDLTPIRLLSLPLYSKDKGRPSFAPEDMMRTYVAMTLCGITSPDEWVKDYLEDKSGFYAIISGFKAGNTPSVGCMYDFTRRILDIPKYSKANNIRSKKKKLTRSQKKA
jgi:hypothetical protein